MDKKKRIKSRSLKKNKRRNLLNQLDEEINSNEKREKSNKKKLRKKKTSKNSIYIPKMKSKSKNLVKKKRKKKKLTSQQKEMQKSRIERMKKQVDKYALIDYEEFEEKKVFTLINIEVEKNRIIKLQKNKINCNCIDFRIRCTRNKIICKHIFYVIKIILKLDEKIIKNHILQNPKIFLEALKKIDLIKKPNNFLPDKKIFTDEDICAICFTGLKDIEIEKLFSCNVCNGVVHLECMICWVRHSNVPGCVYCRNKKVILDKRLK